MAPRRKHNDLVLKSVWDEVLLRELYPNARHREVLWNYLIRHPSTRLADIPYELLKLPKKGSNVIKEEFNLFTTKIVEQNESYRGDTTKLLIELQDGHRIETVIMRHVNHATVCVSSQIGCQMYNDLTLMCILFVMYFFYRNHVGAADSVRLERWES